jgi:hypothetical protein
MPQEEIPRQDLLQTAQPILVMVDRQDLDQLEYWLFLPLVVQGLQLFAILALNEALVEPFRVLEDILYTPLQVREHTPHNVQKL